MVAQAYPEVHEEREPPPGARSARLIDHAGRTGENSHDRRRRRSALSSRTAKVVARATFAVTLALGITEISLLAIDRSARVDVYGFRGFQAVLSLALVVIGGLVLTRRPQNPIGWLFCIGAIFGAMQGVLAEYAIFSLVRHHSSLPLTVPLGWLQNWLWIPYVAASGIIAFQLFPTGNTISPRWRKGLVYTCIGAGVFSAVFSVQPGQLQQITIGIQNPYAASKTVAHVLMAIGGALFISSIAVALASVVVRFRRARGEEREQLKWLAFAGAFLFIAFAGNAITSGSSHNTAAGRVVSIFTMFTLLAILLAMGIAILKYRLYDVNVVISRTLVFSAVALFITVVYVAVVAGIGAAVRGTSRSTLWLSILATAIVAVALQPLRDRARHLANRLVYGQRATPYEALSGFASRISEAYSMDEVLPRLARLMTEATAAVRGAVWLSSGPDLHVAALWPEEGPSSVRANGEAVPPGFDAAFPVRHQGELLGELTVATRPGEPLSPIDEKVLSDLAAQAGLVLRNVRLITDLQASRQRLVSAQDQERRRIERNLHDGAQQQLVALAVKLRLARTVLGSDTQQADGMLEQLQGEAQDALENLRALAHGIYPPLLAERGLGQALRAQAEKSPLSVRVEADGLVRYQQDAEAAVYFCVLECMQNAAKYSGARTVHVDLNGRGDRLTFAVADDGAGFDVGSTARGAGLTNMADRIEALGGRLEISSTPGGGTRISGWVVATPSA